MYGTYKTLYTMLYKISSFKFGLYRVDYVDTCLVLQCARYAASHAPNIWLCSVSMIPPSD